VTGRARTATRHVVGCLVLVICLPLVAVIAWILVAFAVDLARAVLS
jgi:hypothetical protein